MEGQVIKNASDMPMIFKTISLLSLLLVLSLFLSPVAASDVSGKLISFSCSACHGTVCLLAQPGMPSLIGQDANKLTQLLLDFKYDRQSSTVMGRISKGFTDTELQSVALYFSRLKGGN